MSASSPAFEVRPVRESEHETLGDIIVDAYLRDGFLRDSDDPYARFLRDIGSRLDGAEVLVAAEGERVLGGVTLVPPGSLLAELAGAGEAEIRALAVDPAGRTRGVGTSLVAACIERARDVHGAKRVVLCSQETMKAAHRIYERLGFERAPRLDWRPVPDVLLWGYALAC
ncbi:GNAT family N-acetyltransferase [Glycomyces tarimensis]